MIFLFTDFGYSGPYVGELHAVFQRALPGIPVIDLMHDAPLCNPRSSAYLLGALSRRFVGGDACLAVVDPGVGSEQRRPLLIIADNVMYSGPDNGLFIRIVRQAAQVQCFEMVWRPERLSDSFHGRDLFAPGLIRYLQDKDIQPIPIEPADLVGYDLPDGLHEIIFIDRFGNAITGLPAHQLTLSDRIVLNDREFRYARTFSEVQEGEMFWHKNSLGLIELSANRTSVSRQLGIFLGSKVSVNPKTDYY